MNPNPQMGERDTRTAVLRGLRGECPSCGAAPLFARFLKPVPRCPSCGQDWTLHQADDMPAYLVVLILGHILVPIAVAVNMRYTFPMWLEMTFWPGLGLIMAVLMLQPAKGAVIGFQWARRMHGFARGR
jgi:uncharacterized protein (DUF983 family)